MKPAREISLEVMEVLTSRRHGIHQRGNGKKPSQRGTPDYEFFRGYIEENIRREYPIKFFINYSGHKNLNNCGYPDPDESEVRALTFLTSMAKQVEKIYPKGVIIHIISNNARAMFANGADEEHTRRYFEGLERMIAGNEDFSKYFRLFRLSDIWQKEGEEFASLLDRKVKEFAETIDNDPDLEELIIRARRSAKPGTPRDKLKQAVIRFKATLATEKDARIWDKQFPKAIMLSYRTNPAWGLPFLLPCATGRGETTQPWQGYYDKNTNQVMTAARQELQRWMFRQ